MKNQKQDDLTKSLPLSDLNTSTGGDIQKPLAPPASETASAEPNPPDANPGQAKPESAAKPGRSSGAGGKSGKQPSSGGSAIKSKQMVRADHALAKAVYRMGHLIKQRTRLGLSPQEIIYEMIDASDEIMNEVRDAWFFLSLPDSSISLKEKLNRARKVQDDLDQITVVGKVISKFALDHDRAEKLKRHGEALNAYFGVKFRAREVLALLWQRGGILVAEALSRPQGKS